MVNFEIFKAHIIECYPQEGCGYIVSGFFYPVENIHTNPTENFLFPETIAQKLCFKDYKVIHSHTMESFRDDPRIPSYTDMQGQQITQVPWGIVHCDGETVTDILWFGEKISPELLGRDYISNVYDCFTLARDFYRKNFSIDFGTHPRPVDWETWNPHYITQNFVDQGFYQTDKPKVGDVLLFSIGSRYINHIGIYTGNDTFIHHLYKRKSCEDKLSKWEKNLYYILRHRDVK